MKFNQLYDFITENTAQRDYSCLMLDLSFLKPQFEKFQNEICPCEIYDETPGHGLENEPHITCLFGIHTELLSKIRDSVSLTPIQFKIKDLSLFKNEQYDVLKFDIESKDLMILNKELCKKIKHTNKYKDYKPHITVAYLMKGTGVNYLDTKSELVGKTFIVNKFVFSDKSGNKIIFSV